MTLERQEEKALSIHIGRAAGVKCERCWKYSTDIGSEPELPTICGACAAAVRQTLEG